MAMTTTTTMLILRRVEPVRKKIKGFVFSGESSLDAPFFDAEMPSTGRHSGSSTGTFLSSGLSNTQNENGMNHADIIATPSTTTNTGIPTSLQPSSNIGIYTNTDWY